MIIKKNIKYLCMIKFRFILIVPRRIEFLPDRTFLVNVKHFFTSEGNKFFLRTVSSFLHTLVSSFFAAQ